MFKTVEGESKGIIVEKRSKFIANVFFVSSKDGAKDIAEMMRRRYYNARHHCHAYRVLEDGVIIENQNDDGEPTGTAGAPILSLLTRKDLVNVMIVVTRYFGGTFLGTAGLSKAYGDAALTALLNAKMVEKTPGYVIEVSCEYEKQKEFEYFCQENFISIISKDYLERIQNVIEVPEDKYVEICQKNPRKKFHIFPYRILQKKFITTLEILT